MLLLGASRLWAASKSKRKDFRSSMVISFQSGNACNKSHHSQPSAAGTPLRGARVLNVMLQRDSSVYYLKCSSKVLSRAKIKREALAEPQQTNATLGNWCVTMFETDGVNVFVFMSERSLLSFMLTEGERVSAEKLATAFQIGLYQLLDMEKFSSSEIENIFKELELGMFSRLDTASVTGVLTAIAEYCRYLIESYGGLQECNIGEIIRRVNSTPRKTIGFSSPKSAALELIRGNAT